MKCDICNKEFKHLMSLNVHKTLKHNPNYIPPSRRKENNPMYGKKGSNQYIKNPLPTILEREFETLGRVAKRLFLLKERGYKCERCNFNKEIFRKNTTCILQVHHIDGNRKNNTKENLQILCPNCHSITNNFGFNNRKKSGP